MELSTSKLSIARFSQSVTKALEADEDVIRVTPNDISKKIQLYICQDFLDEFECDEICKAIDLGATPSTLYENAEASYRTSYSCNFDRSDPGVVMIEERICELMDIPMIYGETMQGQRYQPGQYFKPHQDYFHVTEPYWPNEELRGGQRTWTAMIFLNEPEAGGETEFPMLGFKVKPVRGAMLMWNNMHMDGTPNEMTLHSGNPVEAGTKYIITKWFRQRPFS